MTSIARTVHAIITRAKGLIVALKKTKLDQSPHAAPKKSVSSQQIRLEVGARSETGYVREENQDRMSGGQTPLGQLYIVADGMGGHKGGAVAAELTVQGLQQYIGAAQANGAVNEVLLTAFKKTNETVYQAAHSGDPATEGMGSTAVLLLTLGQVAWVAHVGDSRAYLYRNSRLRQLTTDHTLVQKMVQAGMLKAEEAMNHPDASVLERAVGNKPSVEVDVIDNLLLNDGDAILLCSDGLSGYVVDAEIESVLHSPATVQEIPERLVELALQKGGEDNVTVQFIQYGARQELLPREAKALRNPAPARTTKLRRPSLQMVSALVLVAVVIAVGFYAYLRLHADEVGPRIVKLEQQLKVAESAKIKAEGEVKNLREELESAEAARTEAENAIKRLQEELKAAGVAKTRAESEVKNLQGQLKGLEAAKVKAKSSPKKLPEEPATAAREVRKPKEEAQESEEQKENKTADLKEETKSGAEVESDNTAATPAAENAKP